MTGLILVLLYLHAYESAVLMYRVPPLPRKSYVILGAVGLCSLGFDLLRWWL